MSRAVLLVAVLLVAGCSLTGPISRIEVARTPSPDGRLDAVVVETDAGATTSSGYLLYVVVRGCATDDLDVTEAAVSFTEPSLDTDGARGIDPVWTGPRDVAARYLRARYTNPGGPVVPATTPEGERVVVTLVPGVVGP